MSESHQQPRAERRGWLVGKALLSHVFEMALLFAVPFILCLSVIAALTKARPLTTGPTAYSMTVTPKVAPPVIVQNVVKPTFSVYFDNGAYKLTRSSIDLLARLRSVTNCETASIRLTPWVSSVGYVSDPNHERNMKLSLRRGQSVRSFLERRPGVPLIEERRWENFSQLSGSLTYHDARVRPNMATPEEALNRRVDIDLIALCAK